MEIKELHAAIIEALDCLKLTYDLIPHNKYPDSEKRINRSYTSLSKALKNFELEYISTTKQ